LHAWVARILLHRGHLEFAREVLGDVPSFARSERIEALNRRLRALTEAEQRGAYAPGRYLEADDWWRNGPFLLETRDPWGNERLARWLACRVEALRENRVILRGIHVIHESDADAEVVATEMSFDEFDRWTADDVTARDLEPGMFIEVGLYVPDQGDGEKTSKKIRVHRDEVWSDEALPHLYPDPLRYLSTS
jgi:hypothetical protein